MTIVLNHTIAPARDKVAAARFFADIFCLPFVTRQAAISRWFGRMTTGRSCEGKIFTTHVGSLAV